MSDEIETIDKTPKSWAAWKREAERLQAIIKEAYSYPEHPIRAIWKWQSRTPRNSDFLAYAHFAFIPVTGDNYLVSLSN
ncbi:hypothetical protein AB8R50_21455 [Klebsiella pneumoniae subsp. ozaenae]